MRNFDNMEAILHENIKKDILMKTNNVIGIMRSNLMHNICVSNRLDEIINFTYSKDLGVDYTTVVCVHARTAFDGSLSIGLSSNVDFINVHLLWDFCVKMLNEYSYNVGCDGVIFKN
ncbi:hypothetical protein [Acinetobacter phage vB_AbM_WUPSU]|nr:hypothetical protein [Acinetobacter phage vB_AbM_WUPSU]